MRFEYNYVITLLNYYALNYYALNYGIALYSHVFDKVINISKQLTMIEEHFAKVSDIALGLLVSTSIFFTFGSLQRSTMSTRVHQMCNLPWIKKWLS